MQSTLVPKGVYEELERLQCHFVWNDNQYGKGWHIISSEKFYRAKVDGVRSLSQNHLSPGFMFFNINIIVGMALSCELFALIMIPKLGRE